MICSEIGNILRQENISNHLNKETILNWTNSSNVKRDINVFNNNNFKDANFENNFLNYILSTKVEINPENKNFKSIFNKIQKDKFIKESKLTQYFGSTNPSMADAKLASIMSQVFFYNDTLISLQTGTIIKECETNNYFICIQPHCDCVRISKEGRSFLFASLNIVSINIENKDKEANFDISLVKENDIIYLEKDHKIYNIFPIKFKIYDNENQIKAKAENNKLVFKSIDEKTFIFIGQLNEIHSIKFVQYYANQLTRIGLIKSDWQRRCSKNKEN